MKFRNKIEKRAFLCGYGLRKITVRINNLKKNWRKKKDGKRSVNTLIHRIRLEIYQIRKHEKSTMRYLHQLERRVAVDNKEK